MTTAPLHGVSFDRILILRLSAFGDIVHSLPAFHNLRRNFPQARIAWAVDDRHAHLLKNYPGLDEVIPFPRRKLRRALARPWLWPAAALALLRHRRRLRAFNPTVSFDFQGNLKSGLQAWVAGAPARVTYGGARERAHRFANFVAQVPEKENRVERPLSILRAAGIPVAAARATFAIPEADRAAMEAWAREKNAHHYLLFHAGTSAFGAIKQWPVGKWSRLADLMAADGYGVIFSWGPGERALAEAAVQGMASGRGFVGPDTGSISLFVALIRGAEAFFGCDSGPLHLAAAVGTPVVALYGPKDPAVYGPYCENHIVVWKGLACSPCTKRRCAIPDCMGLIEPEEVAAAARRLLAKVRPTGPPKRLKAAPIVGEGGE